MKILNKIAIIALIGFSAVSCKGFLDVKPTHQIPLEGSVTTVKDCHGLHVGLYAAFKNPDGLAGSGMILPDIQCDFMLPVNTNSNRWGELTAWTFNSQNSSGNAMWPALYSVQQRANYILENVPAIRAQVMADYDAAVAAGNETDKVTKLTQELKDLNNIIADAHMARALIRVELVKLFADAYDPALAGTQLALPIWNSSAVGLQRRVTMDVYYDSVLSDINVAYTMMDRTVAEAKEIYFTKAAVKSLETRVHVYTQNWKAAIESATEVISGGGYGYELLSAVSSTQPLSSPYAKMWVDDTGSEVIWKVGYVNSDEGLAALGVNFCGLTGNSELRPEFVPSNEITKNVYEATDARLSIFFERRATSYLHGLETEILVKYPGNPALNRSAVAEYKNMPKVFRLSEIYLLRAEAYLRDGQVGMAAADINALRAKRLLNYRDQPYDATQLEAELKSERIRELFMEGHRLYDLKRYKQGFTRRPQDQTQKGPSTLSVQATDVRFTWPIPSKEFEVPGSDDMVENPSNFL